MTDTEVLDAIRKIIDKKSRGPESDTLRDLARYDQIVGLVKRHEKFARPRATKKAKPTVEQQP